MLAMSAIHRSIPNEMLIWCKKCECCYTRMHSSRMRTGRSLTVCCSVFPTGGGFSLVPGGGSPWSRGGGGSPWSGGVLLGPGGGGSPWSGGVFSREPPPVNRITDTCKNITLATTSLRPVKILHFERHAIRPPAHKEGLNILSEYYLRYIIWF